MQHVNRARERDRAHAHLRQETERLQHHANR
jgi:hypothetical protein